MSTATTLILKKNLQNYPLRALTDFAGSVIHDRSMPLAQDG
jgi:DNA gyrase/topoisomerase IV subunit A